jgi:hypothetical protein
MKRNRDIDGFDLAHCDVAEVFHTSTSTPLDGLDGNERGLYHKRNKTCIVDDDHP